MSGDAPLPEVIDDVDQLEHLLSAPPEPVVRALSQMEGDLLVLGVGGKMGPTLARMALRATQQAGHSRRIYGVSRFSDDSVRQSLAQLGVETIQGDLLDRRLIEALPDAENIVYMPALKFGAAENPGLAWAMHTYLPSLVCERFSNSRILAFSTGNIYGMEPVTGLGSRETDPPRPCGEYAMSCLGRERIFEYFSQAHGLPVSVVRLNYACDLRYGVLVDLALKVVSQTPIDLAMGYVNVIWQGDANAMALCALVDAKAPPFVINVAGAERQQVRSLATELGRFLGRSPRFTGQEAADALLSNSAKMCARYGPPRVSVDRMLRWTAAWIKNDRGTYGKPTRYEQRDGRF